MNNSEKISLKWKDFTEENFSSALKELRKDGEFCDVTLAFEDGQQIEAHKVILASSSPFFRDILTKIKHPHPLIYMRSTKSDDFVGILDFLYFGEANVSQDHLDSFLELAGELKLKGLMEAPGQVNEEIIKDDLHQIKPKEEEINEEEQRFTKEERIVAISNQSVSTTNEDLNRQIKAMMSKGPVILEGSQRGRTARICNVCGKEGTVTAITGHIENNHITGVSHVCDICGRINRSRSTLVKHMRSYHSQVSFSEQDHLTSSTRNQVVADIIDVTLAPKEDLQVVFNSVATPTSTNPPSAPPSTCIEPQPTTRPPFTPGWKVDNTKQSNPGSPTSSASGPSAPSPETLAANSQVFKCKQGENFNTRMCNDCDFHWPDLHTLKIHEFNYHGGPYPS